MKTLLADLRDYQFGNDEDLLALGLKLWEEPTTDSERWIHFSATLRRSAESYAGEIVGLCSDKPDHELRLCVRYSLSIDDCPTCRMSDNFDYCFEGVWLEVVNVDSNEPVAAFQTRIETMSELKQLLGAFRAA